MTKYIFAPAETNSEWDGVTFALIEVTEHLKSQFRDYPIVIAELKNRHDEIENISIYGDVAEFFSGDAPECVQFEDAVCMIELSDEQFETLERPDQTICYGGVRFDLAGATFTGTGKHTGDEYWCSVNYNVLNENEQEGTVVTFSYQIKGSDEVLEEDFNLMPTDGEDSVMESIAFAINEQREYENNIEKVNPADIILTGVECAEDKPELNNIDLIFDYIQAI